MFNVRSMAICGVLLLILSRWGGNSTSRADDPPALNPFGPVQTEREDSIPGYVEMSDGKIITGAVYLTRDARLKIYDQKMERQREVPLRVVKQIECGVLKEWMEREWRFKELANDEKYYTGRTYPAREYVHRITLHDDRQIIGPLAAVVYVQPYLSREPAAGGSRPNVKPEKILLNKRNKGEPGTTLKALDYPRVIKLGEEALAEGKRKAGAYRPGGTKR